MASNKPGPVERHLVYEKIVGEKGIWIADIDGSHPRLLVPDAYGPVISPDGKWLVYSSPCTDCDTDPVYLVSTKAGEKSRRLPKGVIGDVSWSPDSKRIVGTQSLSGDQGGLVSIDVESGRETALAQGQFEGWSFSPDDQNIVFAVDARGLYIVGVNGGQPRQITNARDCFDDCSSPVWGPHEIAFARGFFTDEVSRSEIWGIQPDGSGLRFIARRMRPSFFDDLIPVEWSVNGQALLGGQPDYSGNQAVAVDPEKGTVRELGGDRRPGSMKPIAFSGDGRWVLLERGWPDAPAEDLAVAIAPYGGGKASVVASGATTPSWNR
jgi:Tol biopolymer transport system component